MTWLGADAIAQSIRNLLEQLDRSSGREHGRLVSLLINHELALRNAERACQWSESGRNRMPDDTAIESIPKARKAVEEAVRSAGLLEDQASARRYLGESETGQGRPPTGIPEPIALGRIRALGRPAGMTGIAMGADDPTPPATLTFESDSLGLSSSQPAGGTAIIVLSVLSAAIAATLVAGRRIISTGAMAMVLGAAAYAGGPTLLAGGLVLAAFAWHKGRKPPA